MSRIYFHTKNHEELTVWGGERYWLAQLCNDFLIASLDLNRTTMIDESFCKRLLDMLYPKDHYLFDAWDRIPWRFDLGEGGERKTPEGLRSFLEHFRTAVGVPTAEVRLKIAGYEIPTFELAMNTAIAGGSMPVKLAARIHAQCECFGYFEPEAWPWLAETIEEGLARGIFRKWVWGHCRACDTPAPTKAERLAKMKACPECKGTGRGERKDIGWQGLLKFLRETEPELIVMSYSVCDQFPPSCARRDSESDEYPTWDEAVEWLMAQPKSELLSIKLETVTEPGCVYFGDEVVTGWMAHGWEDGGVAVG